MSIFDLKPLTPELIAELEIDAHSLWQVSLGDHVFGPFETLSLKHYARENNQLLTSAQIAQWETDEWAPFFSVSEFAVEEQEPQSQQVSFWILENGQKSAPQSSEEVIQKIKTGKYNLHHEVSGDDGYTWKKLLHSTEFHDQFVSSSKLPVSPKVDSFQEERTNLPHEKEKIASDIIPDLAYVAQIKEKPTSLKLDELTFNKNNEVSVTKSFRWALPTAASAVVVFFIATSLVSQEKQNDPFETAVEPVKVAKKSRPAARRVPAVMPKRAPRNVASVPSQIRRSQITQQPEYREEEYPTQVEIHRADDYSGEYGIDLRERDSAENITEGEPRVSDDIPSLVDNQYPEEQTLDGSMNTISQAPPQNDPIIVDQQAPEEYPAEYPADQPLPEEPRDF